MKNTRNLHKGQNNHNTRPSAHGNPKDDSPMSKRVIISRAKLIRASTSDNFIHHIKQQIPQLYVDVDLNSAKVTGIVSDLPEGIYGNIPVPLY